MNKKFFLVVGAVVLTAAGAFAGRFGAKANVTHLFWTNLGACSGSSISVTASTTLTTGGTGSQATIKSAASGTSHNLYSTSTCTAAHAVHFKA